MAILSVEVRRVARDGKASGAIYGKCIRQQSLAISGSPAELTTAIGQKDIADGAVVFRLVTDTACYVARGTAPDATATAATGVSHARQFMPANTELPLECEVGDLIEVVAA